MRAGLILRQRLEVRDHREVVVGQLDAQLLRLLRRFTQDAQTFFDVGLHPSIVRLRVAQLPASRYGTQRGNLNDAMRVLQLNVPDVFRYSFV